MPVYDFQVNTIHAAPVSLSIYRGKVLLVVNTASKCSYSGQMADLQKLYEKYREKGFEILGFPCNQFNDKEPGDNEEIHKTCKLNFGVTFPLFEKIDVRGVSAHELFHYLTQQAPFRGFDPQSPTGPWMQNFLQEKHPEIYAGDGVKWNYSKFLIQRDGTVYGRYETTTEPADMEHTIVSLLN
ncbi:glutathione peroxidase [Fontibacillus phaseoli]|uniref:Glutathione peroxidase n=1 Tax=Fontibacillus phaseoli TaxID=1416533 RepID=A0A369BPP2_9BACL|nr:glutathione peroxidase [Fontibacillus phaseoli]RCX23513.1 glutathione peroxidase [Fontibacillus phaseoli]